MYGVSNNARQTMSHHSAHGGRIEYMMAHRAIESPAIFEYTCCPNLNLFLTSDCTFSHFLSCWVGFSDHARAVCLGPVRKATNMSLPDCSNAYNFQLKSCSQGSRRPGWRFATTDPLS